MLLGEHSPLAPHWRRFRIEHIVSDLVIPKNTTAIVHIREGVSHDEATDGDGRWYVHVAAPVATVLPEWATHYTVLSETGDTRTVKRANSQWKRVWDTLPSDHTDTSVVVLWDTGDVSARISVFNFVNTYRNVEAVLAWTTTAEYVLGLSGKSLSPRYPKACRQNDVRLDEQEYFSYPPEHTVRSAQNTTTEEKTRE
jgi:hypothetical protein